MIKKYSDEKRQEVFTARQAGATITQIAIQTGIGCTTVKTWLKEAGFRSKHRWHPDEIKKSSKNTVNVVLQRLYRKNMVFARVNFIVSFKRLKQINV